MAGSLVRFGVLVTVVVLSACSVQPVYQPYPVGMPADKQDQNVPPAASTLPEQQVPIAPVIPDRQIAVAESSVLSPAIHALLAKAEVQRESGNLPAAIASLERASKIAPAAAEIYYELAVIYKKMQKQVQLESFVAKALSLSPSRGLKQKLMSLL